MWVSGYELGRGSSRPHGVGIWGALALWLAFGGFDAAQTREHKALISIGHIAPSTKWTPVERWAWSQIEKGKVVDFNERCHTPALDPKKEVDAHWRDPCRVLHGEFVSEVLTRFPWRGAIPFTGVALIGAWIVGGVNLENTNLNRPVQIYGSRIDGWIDLIRARTDSLIDLRGSLIVDAFGADGLRSETDLLLGSGSVFKGAVILNDAKVGGQVVMSGAAFDGALGAFSLEVGHSLLMDSDGENKASFKEVFLAGAKVGGQVVMSGAAFDGALDADGLQVGGSLRMDSDGENKASFKEVSLRGAKVDGQINMTGAAFDGTLEASGLQVGGSLRMDSDGENKASFKEVSLRGAKVGGQVAMVGAFFGGELDAEHLQVGRSILMRKARCAKNVIMIFARIEGNLDLRGAELADLDLWGTSVAGELQLGSTYDGNSTVWNGRLNLRNAHAGNLADTIDSWPADLGQLSLDGFTFAHLGGSEVDEKKEFMRPVRWWDNWARRDPEYSPTPYAQLAAALKNAGDYDAANKIRFFGRERARQSTCDKGWSFDCIWQSTLCYGAGYGIGVYAFRALAWVLTFSLLGAAVWRTVPEVRTGKKTWLWCFGAGLARVLPVIDLNKEFTEFFEGPYRPRLNWLQGAMFYGLRLVGWVLGAILVAAIAGLTQGP